LAQICKKIYAKHKFWYYTLKTSIKSKLAAIPLFLRRGGETLLRMNLPALKGGVSRKRCINYEVRSVRKLFNCGG
ncbi:MAG: hypothetical protein LBJ35_06535, partial [Spirochaetaceae bacterium]|nr:hypothetical protein [Spirochaetaceae bacterium]